MAYNVFDDDGVQTFANRIFSKIKSWVSTYKAIDSAHADSADTATNVTGVIGISNGGTGATTQETAQQNLGISNATITITQDGKADQTFTLNGTSVTINLSDNDTTYSDATSSTSGLMSASDKEMFDKIKVYWNTNTWGDLKNNFKTWGTLKNGI